jgi:hypothetical protein
MRRKDRTFLYAGWYNLILAALSALGGITTGCALSGFGLSRRQKPVLYPAVSPGSLCDPLATDA